MRRRGLTSARAMPMVLAMSETRYDFGRNWSRFVTGLGETQITAATQELHKLVGDLGGKSFLDIGSGSGLHSLAALRLGAARVAAFDYDPMSVAATTQTLSAHAPGARWTAEHGDILSPSHAQEPFDVVYSYGVLHHTGDMWKAIGNACSCCGPGGLLALALYVKTPFCGLWKLEKRLYSRFRCARPLFEALFEALLHLRRLAAGQSPRRYMAEYNARRGMDFRTDLRDWLGGYPYESVADGDLHRFLAARGFTLVRKNNVRPGIGLLGTACGEWVYRKG